MTLKDEATERRLHADAISPPKTGKPKRKPRTAAQKADDAKRAKARRAKGGAKTHTPKPAKTSKPKTRAGRIKRAMSDAEAQGIDVQDWAKKVRGKRAALEKAEAARLTVSKQTKQKLGEVEAAFAEIVMHVPDEEKAAKHNASIRVSYQVVGETKAEVAESRSIAKKKIRDAQKAFDRCFEIDPRQADLPGVE